MNRRAIAALLTAAAGITVSAAIWVGGAGAKPANKAREYVVLYEKGASAAAGRAAVRKAGGRVVAENASIGIATVVSRNPNFARAAIATKAIRTAGRNRPIGRADRGQKLDMADLDDFVGKAGTSSRGDDQNDRRHGRGKHGRSDPLAGLQWDMAMIHATPDGSYDEQTGRKKVLVGVIDTGIDGSHPDIAPNFDRALSRNFTTDIPGLDNGCGATPPPCVDPADQDGDSHGTHVAGTIAAAVNGLGISGVAPDVTLVNLRAGQDSGFFFLKPTIDAMTYAADNGVDVVNMSYFTDPWLFNCRANPAVAPNQDTPAELAEQALIIDATQRAADYARAHGVTLVSALGNENEDLGIPTPIVDETSPDFPLGTEKTRIIDNTCIDVPAETDGVISVSSVGPSTAKSNFSNYGTEQTDVSAPGGFARDFFGTPNFNRAENRVLSTYPEAIARAAGELNADGTPNTARVVRDCQDGVCAYYKYEHGTSMASPHAAGVAALIVSEFGDRRRRGITMDPVDVERILTSTATDTPCPDPPLVNYDAIDIAIGLPAGTSKPALCVGDAAFNGFYGHGIVDALAAVEADED